MSDMKLIMEGWRLYVESLEYNEPKVYLFEEGKTERSEFNLRTLFEQSDKGLLTEEEVLEAWNSSILYESKMLINEGVLDTLKKGYEAFKRGGKFITDKVAQAYKLAAQKLNNFINNVFGGMSIALIRAKKGIKTNSYIQSGIAALSELKEKLLDLKSENPVMFKILAISFATGVILLVYSALSGAAMASVVSGGELLSENTLAALKGLLAAACEAEPLSCGSASELIADLNDYASAAQAGGEAGIDSEKVLDIAKKGADGGMSELSKVRYWWNEIVDIHNEEVAKFNQLRDEYLAQNPGATQIPTDSELYKQQEYVNDLRKTLDTTVQAGKETTLKTIERITAEDGSFSRTRQAGNIFRGFDKELGRGAAKAIAGRVPDNI